MIVRLVAGVALVVAGLALSAGPGVGGMLTVGFCCFVAGVALAAGAVLDVLGVE